MASTGDEGRSAGSKDQVSEAKFMEKLNNMRMLLLQAKSESNVNRSSELMHELTQQSKLATELVFAHDLPLDKKNSLKMLFAESMALNVQKSEELRKKIAGLKEWKTDDNKEDKQSAQGSS